MDVHGAGYVVKKTEGKVVGAKKTKLVEFTIADNRKQGDKKESSYYDIKAWGYAADNAKKFKTGDFVIVNGTLKQERWETEGKKNSRVVVNAFKCYKVAFPDKDEDQKQPF